MRRFSRNPAFWAFSLVVVGCGPLEDVVFERAAYVLGTGSVTVSEGAGTVGVALSLNRVPPQGFSATYRTTGLEAQDGCLTPDFQGSEGTVAWDLGSSEASVEVWIGDDELAETDERFEVTLERDEEGTSLAPSSIQVVIVDDDRTDLIDARADFGLEPGRTDDQSASLQAALDQAAETGRGVVVLAPGDYVISGVTLQPGSTVSARGARLVRPTAAGASAVTLRADHVAPADSRPTLIEGISIDGRRDEQGPYANAELEHAHLIRLSGSFEQPGRLVSTLESITLSSGTASGVFWGPGTDTTVCHLQINDLWRDALTLRGGGSRLRLRDVVAASNTGKSGIWIGNRDAGYLGTRTIDAELEDVRLATGDLELESYDATRISITALTMDKGPLRVFAPSGTVTIQDSILKAGLATDEHNHFGIPHDVLVRNSTVTISETDNDGNDTPESDRSLSAAVVRWQIAGQETNVAAPPHALVFEGCQFEVEADVDPTDTVFAVDSPSAEGAVIVRSSTLGSGFRDWFTPACADCTLAP